MIKNPKVNWAGNVKWNQLFEDEQDLLDALMSVDVDTYVQKGYNGFQYVKSFKEYIAKNQCLTSKQLTTLKRIAKEIYKYHNWN